MQQVFNSFVKSDLHLWHASVADALKTVRGWLPPLPEGELMVNTMAPLSVHCAKHWLQTCYDVTDYGSEIVNSIVEVTGV